MRKLPSYFGLQLKRAARLLPRMLAVTLLLAVLSAMSALILARLNEDDPSRERVRIGVAGDSGEEILSQALDLLQSVDSSRFSVGFVRMEEAEGRQLLEKGELSGLVLFPDGFAQALQYGEHRPVTYLTNTAGSDVGSLMTRELVASISSLILETENAVYGAQALVQEQLPDRDPYRAGDQLVTRYASAILDRARLYALELPQAGDSLSLAASYLCGLSLVFVLLWSVSCSPFFSRRSRELGQVLSADGLGAAAQVFCEFLAFFLLLLCALAAAGLLAFLLLGRFGVVIPELQRTEGSALSLLPALLPPALMLGAFQFLLYELSGSAVSGILLQFLSAVLQGYLSGCFYPSSFFPEGLRRLGALLPAGVGMEYLRAALLALPENPARVLVWSYCLLFLLLSLLLRRRRNRS